MRAAPLLLAALLWAAPAAAQEGDGLIERGMRLLMEGLLQEMEPALRDLDDLARDAKPLLERLERDLGAALEGLDGLADAYHPPEVLPNGDILIRRREPLPDVERNPDGSVDL